MNDQPSPLPLITAQGIALIDLVIEHIRRDHPAFQAVPLAPEVIAALALPSGKPLPPSVQRWLAFDASWLHRLGWFSSRDHPQFTPRRLDEVVARGLDYAPGWAKYYVPLGDHLSECFLLEAGDETCRILVISEPDELGEYPVLVADTDNGPELDIVYPGFDVYLAATWQLPIPQKRGRDVTSTTWFDEPPYTQRLATHANQLFGGRRWVFVDHWRAEGDEVFDGEDEALDQPTQEDEEIPF